MERQSRNRVPAGNWLALNTLSHPALLPRPGWMKELTVFPPRMPPQVMGHFINSPGAGCHRPGLVDQKKAASYRRFLFRFYAEEKRRQVAARQILFLGGFFPLCYDVEESVHHLFPGLLAESDDLVGIGIHWIPG